MNALNLHIERVSDRMGVEGHRLAPPTKMANGSMIYEAVLASPGVMAYSWGPTFVPSATLADDAWLKSLKGVTVTDDDGETHRNGVNPRITHKVRVGTVLGARWDIKREIVIGTLLIDTQRGLDKIAQGVRGVSPSYKVELAQRDGFDTRSNMRYTHVQVRRFDSDNVAITTIPRGGAAAKLQADSMNGAFKAKNANDAEDPKSEQESDAEAPEAEAEDAYGKRLDAVDKRLDEMADAIKAMKAEKDAEGEEPDSEDEDEGNAADAQDAPTAGDWSALLRAADAHDVKAANGETFANLRSRVASEVLGKSVDGLSADALDVAVRLAPPKAETKPAPKLLKFESASDSSTSKAGYAGLLGGK